MTTSNPGGGPFDINTEGTASTASLLTAVVAWLVAVAMVLSALGYGPEARRVPLAVGVPTAVVAGVNALRELKAYLRSRSFVRRQPDRNSDPEPGTSPAGAFAWLAGLVLVFTVMGYLAAVLTFPALLMRFYGDEGARTIVILTAAVASLSYLLLVVALGVDVHEGLLRPVLPWA